MKVTLPWLCAAMLVGTASAAPADDPAVVEASKAADQAKQAAEKAKADADAARAAANRADQASRDLDSARASSTPAKTSTNRELEALLVQAATNTAKHSKAARLAAEQAAIAADNAKQSAAAAAQAATTAATAADPKNPAKDRSANVSKAARLATEAAAAAAGSARAANEAKETANAAATEVVDTAKATLALARPQPERQPDGTFSNCSGFGLLAPLFGVSNRSPSRLNPNMRSEVRFTGPVASGIGGGYYTAINPCNDKFTFDWDIFAFSEGLDPSKTFQVGLGTGLSATAFGKFQFGLAIGVDLVRREMIDTGGVSRSYLNGFLVGNDAFHCSSEGRDSNKNTAACIGRNFTLLLTFAVTTGAGSDVKGTATTPDANQTKDVKH